MVVRYPEKANGVLLSEDSILRDFTESVAGVAVMLRRKKGHSSHESFAYEYGLPRMQYWRVESARTNLTLRSLARLLEIHQLTMTAFLLLVIEEHGAGNPHFTYRGSFPLKRRHRGHVQN